MTREEWERLGFEEVNIQSEKTMGDRLDDLPNRLNPIDQLKEFKILHTEQHGWDVSTIKALDMAIKALEQKSKYRKEAKRWKNKALGQKKGKWIPISERLPEKKGSYLLCLDNDYISTAYYDGNQWYVGSEKERIVAWSPLPKPYRAESE